MRRLPNRCSRAAVTLAATAALAACGSAAAPSTLPPTPTAAPSATPSAATVPVLGRPWAPYQHGYGEARPAGIDNGGDPTGVVTGITWQSWGGATATGSGTSTYVPPGQPVAAGRQEMATVVAFHLGTCRGTLMYQAVEWFFPQEGDRFNPSVYTDICSGTYAGNP